MRPVSVEKAGLYFAAGAYVTHFFPLPFVEKLRVACNFILTCKRILEGWDGDGGGVEREKARSIISAPRTEAGHMGLKRWWNERIL